MSTPVGELYLIDYLKQILGPFFKDADHWLPIITKEVTTENFLEGFFDETQSGLGSFPVIILLHAIQALDKPGGAYFKQVLRSFEASKHSLLISGWRSYDWFQPMSSFEKSNSSYNELNKSITAAISKQYSHEFPGGQICNANMGCTIIHSTRFSYGDGVLSWLNSKDGPAKYGLRSSVYPNNIVHGARSGGCMVEGTKILLADGEWANVENIREGTQIRTIDGKTGTCSKEILVNRNITDLYGINEQEPYMTLEHCVMTQRGWCCLDPRFAMESHSHLRIGRLCIGDVVWQWKNGEFTKVVVEQIPIAKVVPGTVIGYDMHLLEGQSSCISNGYASLVNNAGITAHKISSNITSNMSLAEKVTFTEKLNEMAPLLEKTFGKAVLSTVRSALNNPPETTPERRLVNDSPLVNAVIPSMVVNHADVPDFKEISYFNNSLFINGEPVDSHEENGNVYWHRPSTSGAPEYGTLKIHTNGLLGNGVVSSGDKTVAFSASGLLLYSMSYREEGSTNATTWLDFQMGSVLNEHNNHVIVGKVLYPAAMSDPIGPKFSDEDLAISTVTFSTIIDKKKKHVFHAEISFPDTLCAFGFPFIAAEFNFSLDYRQFEGKLFKYDSEKSDNRGAAVPLQGHSKQATIVDSLGHRLTNRHLSAPIEPSHGSLFARTEKFAEMVREALASKLEKPVEKMTMSVEHLYSLEGPDMEDFHQLCFAKLKNLMLYAIPDDWRKWFGEKKPKVGKSGSLSQAEADLLKNKDIKNFLIDRFAIGYLTQAFYSSTDELISAKFDKMAHVDEKLAYFWQGNADGCFAKDTGYNLAMARIMDLAYLKNVPGLAPYLSDPTGWAKKLFDHCIDPYTLIGLTSETGSDNRRMMHLTTLLHCLDPVARVVREQAGDKVSYGTALHDAVISYKFNVVIKAFNGGAKIDMVEYLTEFFRQYFRTLLEGGGNWDASIRAEASKEIQELMNQFNVDNLNALVGAMGNIFADAVDVLINLKNLPISARINRWAVAYPKMSKIIGGGLTLAVYGFGLMTSIQDIVSNWSQLNTTQKIQAVIVTVDILSNAFSDIVVWQAARNLGSAATEAVELVRAANIVNGAQDLVRATQVARRMATEMEIALPEMAGADLVVFGETVGTALSDAEGMATTVSKWTSLAKVTKPFARGMAIAGLAAAVAVSGYQIYQDFSSNQSMTIKALDIIELIANSAAFLVEAGSGMAAMMGVEVGSIIPGIGIVVAVVGIIIAIVTLFIHRKPPPTPEENWLDTYAAPFIQKLQNPPKKWSADQKKAKKHLKKPHNRG